MHSELAKTDHDSAANSTGEKFDALKNVENNIAIIVNIQDQVRCSQSYSYLNSFSKHFFGQISWV